MISQLAISVAGFSTFLLGRDWFLLPVKVGDDEGCEKLQKKVDDLREKMGMSIPIKIAEHPAIPWAAHGCNCYGAGGITVPSKEIIEYLRENDDTQIAILAHEISHIKHNDGFWLLMVSAVAIVVSSVFTWMVCPPAWMFIGEKLTIVPILTALSIRSNMQERAADVEASKHLTNSQRESIADWFENHRLLNIEWRNSPSPTWIIRMLRKCLVDCEGQSLIGRLTHPTIKSRTEYFRSQITKESASRELG